MLTTMTATPSRNTGKAKGDTSLVDARGLLSAIFSEQSRPTVRWVRELQKGGKIPFYKIGHFVRFDIGEVREVIRTLYRQEVRK